MCRPKTLIKIKIQILGLKKYIMLATYLLKYLKFEKFQLQL